MERSAIGTEVLELEKQFWNAMKNRDSSTATRLSDEQCVVVGPQGIGDIDKAKLAGMIKSGPELKRFMFDDRDVHVRAISDDVAVIAYKVKEDLIVDGKPVSMDAYDSSVWVRRDGSWVCAMHTETVAGDPYGRR